MSGIVTDNVGRSSGLLKSAAGGGGKVLQVLQTVKTDTFTTTSTSYTDVTGMSVTITPSSTSSKILVTAFIGSYSNTTNDQGTDIQLAGTSGVLAFVGDAAGSRRRASIGTGRIAADTKMIGLNGTINFLDSPNTTSATTYKVQMVVSGGTGTFNRNGEDLDTVYRPRTASSITVMEIGV